MYFYNITLQLITNTSDSSLLTKNNGANDDNDSDNISHDHSNNNENQDVACEVSITY